MIIARSLWRKLFVTVIAATAFVALLEVTILDSQNFPWLRPGMANDVSSSPSPGARLTFTATAYCKGLITRAGVAAQAGVAASDPTLLPLGSIVEMDAPGTKYDGIYSILDTGPEIKGREIDVYMWSCYEALDFGRVPVRLTVLRLGWHPHATTPGFMERLFRRPGTQPPIPEPLPSRPVPILPSGTKN
jgi:3D (Asp-Asp-Asp) domain-containing protein